MRRRTAQSSPSGGTAGKDFVNKQTMTRAPHEHAEADRLLAERFMELFRSVKRYLREEVAAVSEMGTSEGRLRSLSALRYLGKSRLKSLAAYHGLSTSAECLMLNQLVQEGLATRSDDTEDRRNVFYEITGAGLALLNAELARRIDIICGRLSKLASVEKKDLAKAIETVLAGVQRLGAT